MTVEGLEELSRRLAEKQVEVDEVLKLLVDEITRRFSADRGTLYLVDGARGELVSRVAHLPEIQEIRLRLGEGIAGWVAVRGEPVNMGSTRPDPRFNAAIDGRTGYRTRSLVAAPVRDPAGVVIGVLQLLNRQGRDFDTDDLTALGQVCTQVASLLSRTSLGGQLQKDQIEPLFFGFNGIVGHSPVMLEVYDRTRKAARTEATVIIQGESGTGKELIARAIHCNSHRKDGPFVKVDCAALPETLVENELFGHERGAYTGADRTRPGKVQAAEKGTLFLDEIGELPLLVQGKLLRLLQDRSFLQVGGTRPIPADIRFVCATHRQLPQLVAEGKFRADLYYRLRVVEIAVPALRERGAPDIDRLADHFLHQLGKKHGRRLSLSAEARKRLRAWPWPGNVRELEHCLESAVVLSTGPILGVEQLDLGPGRIPTVPPELGRVPTLPPQGESRGPDPTLPPFDSRSTIPPFEPSESLVLPPFSSPVLPLEELELAYILHVLAACGGNRSAAARLLGIGRNTLLRKLEGHREG
ncbi:MAG TPA: sigma-54-dependent Fis family transcriptional regulator [Myxococcota bacterium]|nr:sigma-54-dependent Fis family transcriptional regulator [Myxococcota bacterium]